MTAYFTDLLLASMFGGMLIFSLLFAPLVFTKLPGAVAGRFIRAVFPWYYLWVLGFGALSTLALCIAGAGGLSIGLAAAIAVAAALARWPLMRRINALRDRQLAGDSAAGRGFDWLHRLSVAINLVQLLAAAALIGIVGHRF